MVHVGGGDRGPGEGGGQGRQPAQHQVQPVVVGRVVHEDVHHQDVVQVQTLANSQWIEVLKVFRGPQF